MVLGNCVVEVALPLIELQPAEVGNFHPGQDGNFHQYLLVA